MLVDEKNYNTLYAVFNVSYLNYNNKRVQQYMAIKFDDIVVHESPDVSINFKSNFYYMPEIGGNSFSNIESIKTSILSNNKYNMKLLERNIK